MIGMARMFITKITFMGKTGPLDLELMFNHLVDVAMCASKKHEIS